MFRVILSSFECVAIITYICDCSLAYHFTGLWYFLAVWKRDFWVILAVNSQYFSNYAHTTGCLFRVQLCRLIKPKWYLACVYCTCRNVMQR